MKKILRNIIKENINPLYWNKDELVKGDNVITKKDIEVLPRGEENYIKIPSGSIGEVMRFAAGGTDVVNWVVKFESGYYYGVMMKMFFDKL